MTSASGNKPNESENESQPNGNAVEMRQKLGVEVGGCDNHAVRVLRPNDQARRFLSSLVGFENQSFSSQFASKIRRFAQTCKPEIWVNLGELWQTISDSFSTPWLAIPLAVTLKGSDNRLAGMHHK